MPAFGRKHKGGKLDAGALLRTVRLLAFPPISLYSIYIVITDYDFIPEQDALKKKSRLFLYSIKIRL
jgi:hypothetical protein